MQLPDMRKPYTFMGIKNFKKHPKTVVDKNISFIVSQV